MARKKKQVKAKEPVRIRFKALANGNQSIYLDVYQNGKRAYEFLKLYLVPEVDEAARIANANTLQAANAIKAQRIIALTNGKADITDNTRLGKMPLVEWMQVYEDSLTRDGKEFGYAIKNTMRHLRAYSPKVMLKDVDKVFLIGFIDYMRNKYRMSTGTPLSKTTIANNARALSCALNKAVKDGIIRQNPMHLLSASEKPQIPPSQRVFLSVDEIKMMMQADCALPEVKRAFLFACFCGLRHSDVEALTWGQLFTDSGQLFADVVMKKTGEQLNLPLSKDAQRWMPERGDAAPTDRVFNLPSKSCVYKNLKEWAAAAGITKNVSFHTSRHTFATLHISLGADLYSVSKLLGHTNIKVTEVYAKLVSERKVAAVNLTAGVF